MSAAEWRPSICHDHLIRQYNAALFSRAVCSMRIVNVKVGREERCFFKHKSRGGVVSDDLSYLLLVGGAVLFEEVVGICLSRRLGVGLIEETLDAEENFLDRDCRLPRLLFVQDVQTDGAGGIDVWVEERGCEFA